MRDSDSISTTLLARVRKHEPEAWQRFVDLFGPTVFRWCRAAAIETNEAGDVVQEVFLAVAKNVDRFDRAKASGSFTAWIASITRNKINDHYRRMAKRPIARGGTTAQLSIAELPEPVSKEEVLQAQRKLPRRAMELVQAEFEERTWNAFWRTVVEGRPTADVADELSMNPASVYQAKSRILRRLRQETEGFL
ncbi:MAG: sigma-70 family RNA polymerase sigma factor [Planctomycetia bacterium]|jgi:RNA polymerase sigma-70 factor (ECF subfamily)